MWMECYTLVGSDGVVKPISWKSVTLKVQLVPDDWIWPFGAGLWLSEPSEWWLGNHWVYKQATLNKGVTCPLQTALVTCIWHKICAWFCCPHFKKVMKKWEFRNCYRYDRKGCLHNEKATQRWPVGNYTDRRFWLNSSGKGRNYHESASLHIVK